MTKDMKEYWNDKYWNKHLSDNGEENLDFLSDLWIEKYSDIFDNIPRGVALDLGCGLGQYTQYLMDNGFDVISCDISADVLKKLSERIQNAKTLELDMSNPFPFENKTFKLVFANLSIHYFDKATTKALLSEIRRVLADDGYFVGSVNSSQTYKFIQDVAVELEPNYYEEKDRRVRLWNKEQFDEFFSEYDFDVLEEVTTTRWERTKIMWEFLAKPKQLILKNDNNKSK